MCHSCSTVPVWLSIYPPGSHGGSHGGAPQALTARWRCRPRSTWPSASASRSSSRLSAAAEWMAVGQTRLLRQVNFQQGEQFLLSCTLGEVARLYSKKLDKTLFLNINHNAKPRTVCSQEGENDEDITSLDMTILSALEPKNYLHGSSKMLNEYRRHGGPRKLIWDQVQIFSTFSTRLPHHF